MTRWHPTGTVTVTSVECDSEVDFLRYLNAWNRLGDGLFLYTVNRGHAPKGHAALDHSGVRIMVSAKRSPAKLRRDGGWWTPLEAGT